MRINYWFTILLLFVAGKVCAEESTNLFNAAWRFYRGDVSQAMQEKYVDKHWGMVDCPHDWRIIPDSLNSIDALSDTVGWYRKTFTIAPADTVKNVYLCFERIHGKADVWMNGILLCSTSCSYEPVKIDVTRHLKAPYKLNTLAIRVVNAPKDTTVYHGAGITHDIWISKTNRTHLDRWETQVKTLQTSPQRGRRSVDLQINTLIRHTGVLTENGRLHISIIDPDGECVFEKPYSVRLTDSAAFVTRVTLRNPRRWYTDTPDMYRAILQIGDEANVCDSISIPFGVNSVMCSAEMGLMHNDESPLIQGATLDYNNRFTGYTAFLRAEALLVEHMQTYGYTAVRCPMGLLSDHFLNTCDTLGVMVFVDAFSPIHSDEEWSKRATIDNIKRFRNHPSIFMWCINDSVREGAIIRAVDDSRPIVVSDILLDHRWSDERYATGENTSRAYPLEVERSVHGVTMGVSAPDTLQTDSIVWLPETQRWSWPGYEGDTMRVNVYCKNDWVTLYLNEKMIGNVKPNKNTSCTTFYVPYVPGKLDAVTTIDMRNLWQPKKSNSKIKLSGRFKDHFRLFTEEEAKYVYLSADRVVTSNANGELCFVRIDILDVSGNIISDAEIPLWLHIRGPGVIVASGNSRELSPSLQTLHTHQGSAMVVIRPFSSVGTIRLTVRAEGVETEDVTIDVVEAKDREEYPQIYQ